jgi:hypothetical protein
VYVCAAKRWMNSEKKDKNWIDVDHHLYMIFYTNGVSGQISLLWYFTFNTLQKNAKHFSVETNRTTLWTVNTKRKYFLNIVLSDSLACSKAFSFSDIASFSEGLWRHFVEPLTQTNFLQSNIDVVFKANVLPTRHSETYGAHLILSVKM